MVASQRSFRVRTKHRMKRLLAVLLVAGFAAVSVSAGGKSRVAPDVQLSNPSTWIDVIVQFKAPPSQNNQNNNHDGNEDGDFENGVNQAGWFGQLGDKYSKMQAVHMKLPAGLIPALQ